jgi:DNA polymerase-3 subunit alpha
MEYELSIIDRTKYNSYFLVVWDFINAAREMGVPVGRAEAAEPEASSPT